MCIKIKIMAIILICWCVIEAAPIAVALATQHNVDLLSTSILTYQRTQK
jgi:hypothetical protein